MSRKLLLADDSVTIQKVIEITFANQNFDLTMVGNGDDALEKASLTPPDIILADIIMPGKNGYELCRAIKQTPHLAHIPILLLIGSFEPFDEDKARAAGADAWITKPFETQTLIAKVQDLLENASPRRPLADPVALHPAEKNQESISSEDDDQLHVALDLEELSAPNTVADVISLDIERTMPTESVPETGSLPNIEEVETSEEEPEDFLSLVEPPSEINEAVEEPGAASLDFTSDTEDGYLSLDEMAAEPSPESSFELFSAPEKEEESSSLSTVENENEIGLVSATEDESGFSPPLEPRVEPSPWEENELPSQPPFEQQEEEEVLFLSEEDIVLEDEEAGDPGEISFSSFEEEREKVPGDFAFAPLKLSEEPPSQSAEEAPAEPEPVFEIEGFPDSGEEDKDAVEFSFESFAGEDLADEVTDSPPAEPVSETLEFDLSEEQQDTILPEAAPAQELVAEEAPAPTETLSATDAAAIEQKIASLSDDELYALVERVAKARLDRIAQEILERIAWEVVPNLSESLIKEEIRKIKELRH